MRGLPAGMLLEVPPGWEAAAFFERVAALVGPGALSETVPLDREGKLYAAKLSPREVFDCLRYIDFREYCRLAAAEKRRREKQGVEDIGAFHEREMRYGHVGK